MVLDEYGEMAILVVFNLWCLYKYPRNQWLQTFWILGIAWDSIRILSSTPPIDEEFVIVLLVFVIMINSFFIGENWREKKRGK